MSDAEEGRENSDYAVEDLREVVATGLARGGDLLTAGERVVARQILELDGSAARLYARLTPGDHVRDEQAVWFDYLLSAGVAVELWSVESS